jgi:hypothetical protein
MNVKMEEVQRKEVHMSRLCDSRIFLSFTFEKKDMEKMETFLEDDYNILISRLKEKRRSAPISLKTYKKEMLRSLCICFREKTIVCCNNCSYMFGFEARTDEILCQVHRGFTWREDDDLIFCNCCNRPDLIEFDDDVIDILNNVTNWDSLDDYF